MNFHLLKMFVRYWQWFLLSVIICLCAAQLYLFRVTPAYRISGKLMISAADKFNPHIPSKYRNRYYAKHDLQMDINNVGTVSLQIGRYADVTVFVCRAYYTPTNAINQLNALSEENKLPNTCFVLNGVESTSDSWRKVM